MTVDEALKEVESWECGQEPDELEAASVLKDDVARLRKLDDWHSRLVVKYQLHLGAIRRYLQEECGHRKGCILRKKGGSTCDCGYAELLARDPLDEMPENEDDGQQEVSARTNGGD